MAITVRWQGIEMSVDTPAEAAELVRQLQAQQPANETTPERRPQGTGTVGQMTNGAWRFRIRSPGSRINRGGFTSQEAAQEALEAFVLGAPLPPRRRREQRCSGCREVGHIKRKCPTVAPPIAPKEDLPEDLALYESALARDPAPSVQAADPEPPPTRAKPSPPIWLKRWREERAAAQPRTRPRIGSPECKALISERMKESWARRRAAKAGDAPSIETAKQEAAAPNYTQTATSVQDDGAARPTSRPSARLKSVVPVAVSRGTKPRLAMPRRSPATIGSPTSTAGLGGDPRPQ